MKQYNLEIKTLPEVKDALSSFYQDITNISYHSLLFHLYSIQFRDEEIQQTQKEILEYFPNAKIAGTSTNGDICDGHLADYGLVISISLFESTDIQCYLYPCENQKETELGARVCQTIENTPNIKAAEILITLKSINSHKVLDEVEKCSEEIAVFGGGSAAFLISDEDTKVFDHATISHAGVLLVTYSGDDFHVDIHHAIGWKPLGKDFAVTKIEGKRLFELNHKPAGQIYSRYLDIHPDEDFFSNILEFPIMTKQHGHDVLRLPFSCRKEDDSILLAADVDAGTTVHLSYGDPDVIKHDVACLKEQVKTFAPQAIFLYSCGVRRLYWKYLINKETEGFNQISPVSGFYSSGEIMRMGKHIIEHHVTLIAIGMREGSHAEAQPSANTETRIEMTEEQKIHSSISMVRRLANYINVTTSDLEEANQKLQEIADTDELTGLYNRRMLDRLVAEAVKRANKYHIDMTVGIVDIDDFKEINDTYGHASGDLALQEISKSIYQEIDELPGTILGRWGGEEFLFLIPKFNLQELLPRIETARQRVSSKSIAGIGTRTISLGVTEFHEGDTASSLFQRADEALYKAKTSGKNKTCTQ